MVTVYNGLLCPDGFRSGVGILLGCVPRRPGCLNFGIRTLTQGLLVILLRFLEPFESFGLRLLRLVQLQHGLPEAVDFGTEPPEAGLVGTARGLLHLPDGIHQVVLAGGVEPLELVRPHVGFRLFERRADDVGEHTAELPEHGRPVNGLLQVGHVQGGRLRIALPLQGHALSVILRLAYLFRVPLGDGELLLLVSAVLFQVVAHGCGFRLIDLYGFLPAGILVQSVRPVDFVLLRLRQPGGVHVRHPGLPVGIGQLAGLLFDFGLALVIVCVYLRQLLVRSFAHQVKLILLVLQLQGDEFVVQLLLRLSAPFGFLFGLVGGLALALGILVLAGLVPVVFLLGQAEGVLQFLGLLLIILPRQAVGRVGQEVVVGFQGLLVFLPRLCAPVRAGVAPQVPAVLLGGQLVELVLQLVTAERASQRLVAIGNGSVFPLLGRHPGQQVLALPDLLLQRLVADAGQVLEVGVGTLLAHLFGQRLPFVIQVLQLGGFVSGQTAYLAHPRPGTVGVLPSFGGFLGFQHGNALVHAVQLILRPRDGLSGFQLGDFLLDALDVFQLLVFGVILGEDVRVFLFELVQRLAPGVGGQALVTGHAAKFLQPAPVFLLCLDGLLLGGLVFLLGFLQAFGLGLHRHHRGHHAGNQRGHQHVGVGEHRGVEQLLRLLHDDEPAVMQGFGHGQRANAGRLEGLHGGDGHDGCFVCPIGADKPDQYAAHLLVVVNQVGHRIQRTADNAFGLLPDFIHHHADAVLNVADASGDGLALLLHEVVEHAALVREVLQGLLHFRETDLAGLHHPAHLALRHAQDACQLTAEGDAAAHKLVVVCRIKAALRHGGAVKINQVIQGLVQSGGDVAQADEVVVDVLHVLAVGQQLARAAGYALQVERGGGRRADELLHQRAGLFLAAQHGTEGGLQLLELAAHLDDVADELLHGERPGYLRHGTPDGFSLPVQACHLRRRAVGLRLQLVHLAPGLVEAARQAVAHQYLYFYGFRCHFISLGCFGKILQYRRPPLPRSSLPSSYGHSAGRRQAS